VAVSHRTRCCLSSSCALNCTLSCAASSSASLNMASSFTAISCVRASSSRTANCTAQRTRGQQVTTSIVATESVARHHAALLHMRNSIILFSQRRGSHRACSCQAAADMSTFTTPGGKVNTGQHRHLTGTCKCPRNSNLCPPFCSSSCPGQRLLRACLLPAVPPPRPGVP
jgi:hypothetical protein